MIRLRIKNFGPIGPGLSDNEGWIDFKRVTVFIGNQGAGKSTLAKLFSTFSWIEKALVRGDYEKKWFERKGKLKSQFLSYHRLENYLETSGREGAEIEYEGEACKILYAAGQLSITETGHQGYALPQVMYVPAERNFISYVRNPRELKLSSDSLKEFLTAFDEAKDSLRVVAAADRHDTACALGPGQPEHPVECAAHLEGARLLKELELEVDVRPEPVAERRASNQWRAANVGRNRDGRLLDILEGDERVATHRLHGRQAHDSTSLRCFISESAARVVWRSPRSRVAWVYIVRPASVRTRFERSERSKSETPISPSSFRNAMLTAGGVRRTRRAAL